ncbi:MAG: YidC/Oxa1 family insertase periplasmic-domain containing protein, partial [Gemmataceae bacterium]
KVTPDTPKPAVAVPPVVAPVAAPLAPASSEPHSLIALGDESFFLKVLLTNVGGGVQQVILSKFNEANRLGLEEKDPANKPRPLHLIPGYVHPLPRQVSVEAPYIELNPNFAQPQFDAKQAPGPVAQKNLLARPSYTLLHYLAKDDAARRKDDKGKLILEDDNYPSAELAERTWKVVQLQQPKDGQPWVVAFETELPAPYFVRVRKTFTLHPKEYDFRLALQITALPGRQEKVAPFRYQLAGPIGLPIEGEWYTSTFRNSYIGFTDNYNTPRREVEDSGSIHMKFGGEKVIKANSTLKYAAIGTQYFASALAVVSKSDPWEYVRPTREQSATDPSPTLPEAGYDKDRLFLLDISFRAVSPALELKPNETVDHEFAVYNGPIKVRLLKQLEGDRAVDPAIVDRYLEEYQLTTLTDFHSPSAFGRFLNAIWWTDIVVVSTNTAHWLLGKLHGLTGSWGLSIILLTIVVKLCLILPSRRQQMIAAEMQAKIAVIKPDLDKINEKYKDDFMLQQQARSELMRKAGVNQFGQLGGCLLMFAQMPILMGLYFCLQESVFFRLEPFGWLPNLAAPDMLARWGEGIPVLSDPDNRFGSFSIIPIIPRSFLYLGPYFNILPLAAVILFYVQQKLTMPPPTNDMEEQQRSMLKYMLIVSGLVFYKFASGLSIYFIVGGLWTIFERKLIPKPKVREKAVKPPEGSSEEAAPPKPTGFMARMAEQARKRMKELQDQAETQRQIRNNPNNPTAPPVPPGPNPAERAKDRKNKKKRK